MPWERPPGRETAVARGKAFAASGRSYRKRR